MTTQVAMPKALGRATSEETVRANLERYCELALQWGASEAACIPAGDVIIDDASLLCPSCRDTYCQTVKSYIAP